MSDYNQLPGETTPQCTPDEDMGECLRDGINMEKERHYQSFRQTALVHRYDYEIERRNFLVSQSTFILGAIGLVMTLGLTYFTSDRFSLQNVNPWILGAIVIGSVSLAVSAGLAIGVLITVHQRKYCVAYPSNLFIAISHPLLGDLHTYLSGVNSELSRIVQRNSSNNDISTLIMQCCLLFFVIGVFCTLFSGLFLVLSNVFG